MNMVRDTCLLMLAAMVASVTTGCGSGASTKPTVTVKPRSDSASPVSNGGTNPANGDITPAAGGVGIFKGVVTYVGTPPVMGLLPATRDAICIANKDKIKDQSLLVDSNSKGIKNVFVYLANKPKGVAASDLPEKDDVFDQKMCEFLEHAKIVRVGHTINVLNSDPMSHNTNVSPISPLNSKFNPLISPGESKGVPLVFQGSEKYPLKVICDIHSWMSAYILPLDHEFYAVTDENGEFEISGLPAGEHQFVIWHEKGKFLNRRLKVIIKAEQTTEEKELLKFNADKFKG